MSVRLLLDGEEGEFGDVDAPLSDSGATGTPALNALTVSGDFISLDFDRCCLTAFATPFSKTFDLERFTLEPPFASALRTLIPMGCFLAMNAC